MIDLRFVTMRHHETPINKRQMALTAGFVGYVIHKKGNTMLKKCLSLLLICLITGCATIHKDWENAQRINTADGYNKFLSEHLQSEYSQTAKDNIEKLEWGEARQLNTVDAYRAFLSSHPKSEFAQTAKDNIEKLEWGEARQLNTVDAYQAFLSSHPKSEFAQTAEGNIEKLEWGEARQLNTVDAYRAFLSSHPKSEFAQTAKDNIEKLEWGEARQLNTVDAYQAFLSSHPKSEFAQTAKDNIEKLEWDEARQLNTVDAYQAFLSSHPKSEFAQTAEDNMINIINELEKQFKNCKTTECSDRVFSLWENAVWESIKELGGREGYAKYLLLFPNGKHVSPANEAIDDIDWHSCKDERNTDSCERYLLLHQKGKYIKEAKQIIVDNEFMTAKQKNTVGAYDEFLKSHRYHEGALTMRRQLLYSIAVASGKLEDWGSFYDKSQVSSYKRKKWDKSSQSAYEQMMTNAETEIERLLYEKAIANPSLNNYRAYLKRFPKGSHRQQIIVLMEPLFFKEASSTNTVESYNNYLHQYPSGFSGDKARALLDPVLWAQTRKENHRDSYEKYIKKFPNGLHAKDAEKKISWMKLNPAIPKISFPKQIIGTGSNPRFSWVTTFTEKSDIAGYSVSGSGWILDKKGNKYGPGGHLVHRSRKTIKPGGQAQDDDWVRGSTFCGGKIDYDWTGQDTNGHPVKLKVVIDLICK